MQSLDGSLDHTVIASKVLTSTMPETEHDNYSIINNIVYIFIQAKFLSRVKDCNHKLQK